MPIDYSQSKIILFFSKDQTNQSTFILTSTTTRALAIAELRRKYKQFLVGNSKGQEYYPIIDKIGIDNLEAKVIAEAKLSSKAELNEFLKETKAEIEKTEQDNIKENKTDLKEITIKRYEKTFVLLKTRYGSNNPFWFNEPLKVIEFIKNYQQTNEKGSLSTETQKNYYKALIAVIPEGKSKEIYRTELMRLDNIAKSARDSNEMSLNQCEKWVDYSVLLQSFNDLKNQPLSTELVVASFYSGVYFAPWRVMELQHLKVRNYNPETDNYIDFKHKTFVLNIYKTFKDKGRIIQKIPAELYKMLVQFTSLEGTFLLENQPNTMLTYYELNKIIKSIFGVSASLIRNIYVSHLWDIGKMKTNQQIKAVASQMRNSFEICMSYRKLLKAEELNELND